MVAVSWLTPSVGYVDTATTAGEVASPDDARVIASPTDMAGASSVDDESPVTAGERLAAIIRKQMPEEDNPGAVAAAATRLIFTPSTAQLALAALVVHERMTLLEALRLLAAKGGDAVMAKLSEELVATLLCVEKKERGEFSDLTLLENAPKAWTYVRWRVDAATLCVVTRGHRVLARRLRPEPRMAYVTSLLSPEECAHIVNLSQSGGELHPSRVVNTDPNIKDTGQLDLSARTSESCRVSAIHDAVVKRAVQRAAFLAGLSPAYAEAVQVVHYDSGQEYKPHCDFFQPKNPRFQLKTAVQGNRLISFFVYLTGQPSEQGGGRTAFPQLGVGFAPRVGCAAMWYNLDRHGNPDERTLHAGEPVKSGEKWGMNIWLRERSRYCMLRRSEHGPITATLMAMPEEEDDENEEQKEEEKKEEEEEGGAAKPAEAAEEAAPEKKVRVTLKLRVPPPKQSAGLVKCPKCGDESGPIGLCLCRDRYAPHFLGTYQPPADVDQYYEVQQLPVAH